MRVLVVGGGGREHALVWKLAASPHVDALLCAPGNAGIAGERLTKNGAPVECVPIGAEALPQLLTLARERHVDFTVVGPDNPLALGIVDSFEAQGLAIWGPRASAARFEASKAFSQGFMERHGIPTAAASVFDEPGAAKRFAASLGGRCVVKADGLALGKGVLIATSQAEADRAIERIMLERAFGAAGARVVIQEYLEGVEVSLHALCDGKVARLFPTAQDHKRALDGDRGANTGGMGAYSPVPFLSGAALAAVQSSILDPFMRGCAAEGIDFRGILYPGLMLTAAGPRVLEFNARFGDPEAQVYLTRLQSDLLELLQASAGGTLEHMPIEWSSSASLCVVMASAGYPGSYARGETLSGLEAAGVLPGVKVFHAGTALRGPDVVTNGGRVLGVTALGKDLADARSRAYAAVEHIHFTGAQFRRDIGSRALASDP